MIRKRLEALRQKMRDCGIQYYIIPTNDCHLSEYVGAHFRAREYMSGFTGSAGVLVVGEKDFAGLWTDGRYYIQAEAELAGSTIQLFKAGSEGVPRMDAWLDSALNYGDCIGFDGRMSEASLGLHLAEVAAAKGGRLVYELDLVGELWEDRPDLPKEPAFLLDIAYAGESVSDKLARVRAAMAEKGAGCHILTVLDDIAWLYNMRGNDIPCNPVVLAYTIIEKDKARLFMDAGKLNAELTDSLKESGVTVLPYDDFYEKLAEISAGSVVMYDQKKVNYTVEKRIPSGVVRVQAENPTVLMKAVKNETQIANLIQAHVKDGLAVTRFMFWLKDQIGKIPMTEITASDYLEALRRAQEDFLELSFETISAYGPNAAMMHYCAQPDSTAALMPEGLLLVDSGGHYLQGTTDITRTYALGPVSDRIRTHYTAVLRGFLNLQAARFLYGCIGINLDILARGPMWDMDIDYLCGTGHGVGYLLGVHEPPNGFRWKRVPEREDAGVLEAGMVTTDEPGIYEEGSHGIRIENELLCCRGAQNEYGQFMYFEPLTFAPVDLDPIDETQLTALDVRRLNAYHRLVYEKLSPYMEGEELQKLAYYTRAI